MTPPRPALLLLLAATASCSVALDFSAFRFGAADAGSVTDRGATADLAPDATVDDLPADTLLDDLPADTLLDDLPSDIATDDQGSDLGRPTDELPIDSGTPPDLGAIDRPSPSDVAPDAAFDAGVADRPSLDAPDVPDAPDAPDVPDVPLRTPRSCIEALVQGRVASALYAIDDDDNPATPTITVYCDQTREGGGWLRVATAENGMPCPSPFAAVPGEGACGRVPGPTGRITALPVTVPVPFREVRGRLTLKARGDLDAFGNVAMYQSWDDTFVDGVTVSRVLPGDGGPSRQHVFTWAVSESSRPLAMGSTCPCRGGGTPLAEVGTRYLCRELLDLSRDAGVAVDVTQWREPEGAWFGPGVPCTAGDRDGWMRVDLGATLRTPLEVRLTVSGQAVSGVPTEDLGFVSFELYVR